MLSYLIDIARVGQYMRLGDRVRRAVDSPLDDLRFLARARRGLLPLPVDRPASGQDPFPAEHPRALPGLAGRRVALVATGGSGALASLVGVVEVLREAGITPVAYGVCSGSALFGIPLAAGLPPREVARATLALRPADYLDPDWTGLAAAPLRAGRGWAGLVRGEALERTYHRLLGDRTLGDLPTPVWFPMWNIEANRLEYVGSATHPDLPAARAVHMAVCLPLAFQPVRFQDGWWLDGGIVEILPARPLVGTDLCDVAVVVNGFYAEGFEPDHEPRWRESPLSILHVASQTRLMGHIELTRRTIADLAERLPVVELAPVEYSRVHGAGLYGEFLDNTGWADHMAAGYRSAAATLADWSPQGP